jgi:hypothetical protein
MNVQWVKSKQKYKPRFSKSAYEYTTICGKYHTRLEYLNKYTGNGTSGYFWALFIRTENKGEKLKGYASLKEVKNLVQFKLNLNKQG